MNSRLCSNSYESTSISKQTRLFLNVDISDDCTTFMFEFKKKKFSWIVRGERCFSSDCRIDGLSWKIFIEKRKTDGSAAGDKNISSNDTLGVFMNVRFWISVIYLSKVALV